jgi:hypothetical protein
VKTFPSLFAAEIAKKRGARPVWILAIDYPPATKYISDTVATIPTGWQPADVVTLPWVDTWGDISEQVTGSLNEIRIADFSVSLISDPDDSGNIDAMIRAHNMESCQCRLYLWFAGLNPYTDPPQEFYRGYVRDIATRDGGMTWNMTLEDESSRLTGNFGEVLSPENYPYALPAHVGRFLPIVFGTAKNVMPPVAKAFGGINYYLFGCPLSAIGTVVYANGTTPVGLSTNLANINFGGKATIQCNSSTASAVMGTQQATVEPTCLYSVGSSYAPSSNTAIDGNDATYYFINTVASLPTYYTFLCPLAPIKVKGRFLVAVTNSATITMSLKTGGGTLLASVSATGPFAARWLDTGWITNTSTAVNLVITYQAYPNQHQFYGSHLDMEYASQVGTTYAPQPTDLICLTASQHYCSVDIHRPTAAASTNYLTFYPGSYESAIWDGNISTYAYVSNYGTMQWQYNDNSISWGTHPPLAYRAGIRIACDVASGVPAYVAANILTSDGFITSTITFPSGPLTTQVLYGDWAFLTGILTPGCSLYLQILTGTAGVRIFDIWIETTYKMDQPDAVASFLASSNVTGTWSSLPSGYQVHGTITESKRVIDHLDYLAFQFRCWFRISCGVTRLIWRPDVLIPDLTVRPGTIIPWSTIGAVRAESGRPLWTRQKAPKTDIVNSIRLKYSRDYSLNGDTTYSKIYSTYNSASIADFGQLARNELFQFDFVTQDQHAQLVGDFYLSTLSKRYWLEELDVFLDQISLEFGDIVTLPDGRVGVVVSVGIQPGSIEQMDRIKLTVMV